MVAARIPGMSADEARAWQALMAAVIRLPAALDKQLGDAAGVSNIEYGVLATLVHERGRALPLRRLADTMNSTISRMSRVIDRLERQGWVVRRPDADDGRVTRAVLTDAGRRLVAEVTPAHVQHARALVFDVLSAEQVEQLGVIATAIADAASGHPTAATPTAG